MKKQHLIWDMGGTMVNTYPEVDAALKQAVQAAGHQIDVMDVAPLTRVSIRAAIAQLAEKYGMPAAVLKEAERSVKRRWQRFPAPAMPGVQALAAAVPGLNLVVTHRDRESATALLEGLGVTVDAMVCAPDGYARKPDPEMFQVILAKHGLDPATCLAVGDRPIDAVAAHRAGIEAAMIFTPGIPLDSEADYTVDTLTELLPLFA
ncbi:haloacid dehalogenase superfamily, subfamily IA, variant 3 with third motif having DD or ED/haloacid dehalogenase superfamily, subfamily IA, variant 1 with third motif having Dx(3-4)D or Dx(3-4)E [Actinobaculum suis]|uniref:HAD-IA family hydrolase n=1 Tax=Actinobaculum suis TaxID=1657 RepID=A0A1G7DQV8_9ACTO|nr:HAD-IA family hydrolase [Actinobaculum suis]MDY5153562.1 HAD-IA family hydrolase [Actinobaculum suis]SDE53863.1 haloacid dehalogenase superfamily, subfamily IA, variant 3 with third motif having DD or ED/haloacid dehalogenase superfamily, subfamily IA, variant 1 with third motif having Dx(3-4)D or Dx(3-4)E [Actinobaculum suis]VDG75885.1 phosphatase [Actinobaculum suis]